jgi:hypothetical protein
MVMVIKLDDKTKALVASYVRSAVGAGLAVYASGVRDVRGILSAAGAAVVPPLLRWVNKADTAFGRGSK